MSKYELTDVISDLLEQTIRESGVNAMTHCPLHEDRHPSLSVHLNTGVWLCHSCGARGGLEQLARICGGEISADIMADRAIRSVTEMPPARHNFADKARQYHRTLTEQPTPQATRALQDYCKTKGVIYGAAVRHFGIGWTGQALSFPYWEDGNVPMLKYRLPDGSKFAEPGSVRSIYNGDEVRGVGSIIVAEGESDTHAIWGRIRDNARGVRVCGIPGAAVSEAQWEDWALDFMFAERIGIVFDADATGDAGAEVAMRVLGDRAQRFRPTRGKDMVEHLANGGTFTELVGG